MTKSQLRTFYRGLVRNIDEDRKKVFNQKLQEQFLGFFEKKEGLWAAYLPLNDEVDLLGSLKTTPKVRWCFPRIQGEQMDFVELGIDEILSGISSSLEVGSFKILQPKLELTPVEVEKINGFLIPGLAFDRSGIRLGRGKGYYDKTLSNHRGLKVGVCYSAQISHGELINEPHDIRMDCLITENEVLKIKGN